MKNLFLALGKIYGRVAKISAILLLFLSITKGFSQEETKLLSSQSKTGKDKIRIQISESVKNERTVNEISENLTKSTLNVILTTELSANGSFLEAIVHPEKPTTNNLKNEWQETKEQKGDRLEKTQSKDNYYDAIKPTKTVILKKPNIAQTKISHGSGESKGVSMSQSRPQKNLKMTNYKRTKRGFGNPAEKLTEEQKLNSKTEGKNFGKSYNHIKQTLRKIAKVTVNNETEPVSLEVTPINFRESREEENRKASPDIQDIISGIVNILNGKATKQTEGNTGRPRPSGTRINNRGPPRISDVPPLDFDGPPAYRPLPPPPPKRVPPPYPFDIPPSISNIPLPPQPQKPLSKLPPHPFIDGVPIPEIMIPDEQLKQPSNNHSIEQAHLEYDTISMSEPTDGQSIPPITAVNTTEIPVKSATIKNTALENGNDKVQLVSIKTGNSTVIPSNNKTLSVNNSTTSKGDKIRAGGHKPQSSSGFANKNTNKRVNPNPVTRLSEKPILIETTTAVSVAEEIKNKSDLAKIGNTTESPSTGVTPIKEKISDGTETAVENFLKKSTNVSTVLSVKPLKEAEIRKNKTGALPAVTSTSFDMPTKHIRANVSLEGEHDMRLPISLEPSIGIGEATPLLETSVLEISMLPTEPTKIATTVMSTQRPKQPVMTGTSYKARPGIVLDDPEYKPGGHKRPAITARPIITAPPPHSHYGEIFDVTVHAVQGPDESSSGKPLLLPVNIDEVQVYNTQVKEDDVSVITKPENGQNFVSIDGKRTYINLFGEVSPTKIIPTSTQPSITGTGYAVPHKESPLHQVNNKPAVSTSSPRRPYKKPSHPPVRIDTCIVGDDTTCDSAQNEMCKTEDGVSSCHCRPGYSRRNHRDTCRRVVSMVTSLRVDKLYDRKVKWQDSFRDPESEEYQQLSYEASQAIESAMSMTPFSDDFINSRINSIYAAKNLENNEPAVYVNVTIQLEENLDTVRPAVKHDIQRHLLRVIQRRNNNVGNSAVWVDASPGSILSLQDIDECISSELHDCHERATCLNTFGSFRCQCPIGSRDPWVGNIHREGRFCETCSQEFCNNRGECNFEHGQQVCHCYGNFYGAQCEIDGEVLGVAIGASVAAAIIIVLTLICLCMWSRRWSREQKTAVGAGMGSPVFGYMTTGPTVKTPSVGSPPYQVSIEDRIRWAQIADVMAKSNHYAQPEPVNATTRTSFAGYPTLPSHTLNMKGTLPLPTITPPVPLPRLTLSTKQPLGTYGAHSQFGSIHQSNYGVRSSLETNSSEEDADRVDLLGRNFNAPRPKSRTSVANQSGIYYDVDYDRSDAYSKQNTIPLNTYTLNPQHQVRPYFR